MEKEFNLSECKDRIMGYGYNERDVKEFIKRLKDKLRTRFKMKEEYIIELVDELAGDKLK